MNPLEQRLAQALRQKQFDEELEHAVTLCMKIGSYDYREGLELLRAIGVIAKTWPSAEWNELVTKIEELWKLRQIMENDE